MTQKTYNFHPASGTDVNVTLSAYPKGTGSTDNKSEFIAYGTDFLADHTNYDFATFRATGSSFYLSSGKAGTGTLRPLIFSSGYASGSGNTNQLYLDTNGNIGVNKTSPASAFDVSGRIQQSGAASATGYLLTNSGNLASTSDLNPGMLVYGGGSGVGFPSIDLGYNSTSTRYRLRINSDTAQDVAFSFTSARPPTQQSDFNDSVVIRGDSGRMGIGTPSPGSSLSIVSPAAQGVDISCNATGGYIRIDSTTGTGIFGVDTSGNTFVQTFSAGKDIVFYDDTANPNLTVKNDGVLIGLNYLDLSAISAGSPNFKITATSDAPAVTWGAAAGNEASAAPAGYIEILVGANTRYIPFWA